MNTEDALNRTVDRIFRLTDSKRISSHEEDRLINLAYLIAYTKYDPERARLFTQLMDEYSVRSPRYAFYADSSSAHLWIGYVDQDNDRLWEKSEPTPDPASD